MADALDAVIDRLLALAVSKSGRQASDFRLPSQTEIDARERQMGRCFPIEVRRLLERVGVDAWGSAFWGDSDLLNLHEIEAAAWVGNEDDFFQQSGMPDERQSSWQNVDLFNFAWFCYGDDVLFCPSHPELGSNFILLADHESDERAIVLAPSLATWINRLCDHGGTDYAYVSGDIGDLPAKDQFTFVGEHARLNPHVEWPARWLFKREHPKGHPLGYHHWDRRERRLRPVGEVPNVSSVYLESPTSEDIRSLLTAPWIPSVSLSEVRAGEQVATLAAMPNLEYLGLRNVSGTFDASDFAACRVLQKLAVSGTRIIGVHKLAGIETLRQIEVANADYQLSELEELQARRPKLYIDVIDQARRNARKRRG